MALDDLLDPRGRPLPIRTPADLQINTGLARRPVGGIPPVDAGRPEDAPSLALDQGAAPTLRRPDVATGDPYAPGGAANSFERGVMTGGSDIAAGVSNLRDLARVALGDEDTAVASLRKTQAEQQFSALRGPQVDSIKKVDDASSLGDYLAGQAGAMLPAAATMLLPGGVAGGIGRRVAAGAVERAAAKAGEGAVVRATTEEAAKQIARATTAGRVAGVTVGGLPPAAAGNADVLLDDKSPDSLKLRAAKVIAGDVVVSALGAVPEMRVLSKFAPVGEAAAAQAAKTGERLFPTIVKEAAKQGALAGTASTAQVAATLATHKWVNDNVDLLSPEAFDQYLNAMAGGTLIGGGMGAATAFAPAGARAARTVVDKTAKAASETVASTFDKARGAVGKAGEPVAPADAATPPPVHPAAADAYSSVMGALQHPEARAAASNALAEAVSQAKGRFDAAPQATAFDTLQKAYRQALDDAQSPEAKADVQRGFAEAFAKHSPIDEAIESASSPEVKAAFDEHLGALADEDPSEGFAQRASAAHDAFMAGADALGGEAPRSTNPVRLESPLHNTLAAFIPRDSLIWHFPDELKTMVQSASKLFTGDELTAKDRASVKHLAQWVGKDTVTKWEKAGPLFAERTKTLDNVEKVAAEPERLADVPKHEVADRLVNAEPGTPEHTALRDELRGRLLKDGDTLLTENRSSPAASAKAAEWAAKSQYVELAEPKVYKRADGTSYTRKQYVDMSNLIGRKLGEEGYAGKVAEAYASVLNDLRLAGVEVKPESIQAGKVFNPKTGDGGHLTPAQAELLRSEKPPARMRDPKAIERSTAQRERAAAKAKAKAPDVEAKLKKSGQEPIERDLKEKPEKSFDAAMSEGSLNEAHERVPRELPPSEVLADGRAQVSTARAIADVQIHQPHEKTVQTYLKERSKATTPAERATLRHKAGVEVGERELKRLHENGHINERAYARQLAALRDESKPIAREYLRKAAAGDFDSARVTESRTDKARPARGLRDQAEMALAQRYEAATGKKGSMQKVADLVDTLGKRDPKSLTPAETKLVNAARAAVDALPEDHPVRAAAEASAPEVKAPSKATDKSTARADDDVSTGFKEAARDKGPHDHKKEERMLNALLDRLGVKEKITVRPLDAESAKTRAGQYRPDVREVHISPNLHGAERIEVLAHELGHHVIETELGGDLQHATPELREALTTDYQKWVKENFAADRTVSDVLSSRKPYVRGEKIKANSNGATVADLATHMGDEKVGYLYDMHEYMADHLARALTSGKEGQGVIGKFFSDLAQKFRTIYDTLFGTPEGKKYAPAPSVEAWVKSMFDRTTNDVREAVGHAVSAEQAKATTRAALHAAFESVEARASDAAYTKATAAIDDAKATLGRIKNGGPKAPANGGKGGGSTPQNPKSFKAWTKFVRYQLTPDQRRVLERALDRRVIELQVMKEFGHDAGSMRALDDPKLRFEKLSHLAYQMWARGDLSLGPRSSEVFLGLKTVLFRVAGIAGNNDFALRMMTDIQNGRIERTRAAGREYDPRALEANARAGVTKQVQQSFNIASGIARQYIAVPFRKWAGPGDYVHLSGIPAHRALAGDLKLHTGEHGKRMGMISAVNQRQHQFVQKAADALQGLSARDKLAVTKLLQERQTLTPGKDATHAAAQKVRALFDELHGYLKDAGVDAKKLDNYFPVVMDRARIAAKESEFRTLLAQPHFEASIRDYLAKRKFDVDKLSHDQMVGFMVDAAKYEGAKGPSAPDPLQPGGMKALNERIMQFIYDEGTPQDISTFAKFQVKDPERVLTPYITQAVRRAEFVRRAGEKGERFEALLKRGEKQGATPQDTQYMRDYISSANGAYGADGSPFLRKYLPGVADLVVNDKSRKAMDWIMAYQNVRLLPLSLLSSLADPLGIFVRTGGDFGGAWSSFRDGFRAMSKGMGKNELRDLADTIGVADDYVVSDMLSNGYGGEQMDGIPRKISDTLFKLNGMTSMVKFTRYMALAAGQRFLMKHAAGGDATSQRFLRELGVKAGDIRTGARPGLVKLMTETERASASKAELAADDRVRTALVRFVDEAILRTDASQHPLWFNDPAFRLVAQYKSFAYAFADQILGRIRHELHYQNLHVLAPAAAYFPITAMGEMLRGIAQYGPGGNPHHDDWSAGEYAQFIAQRTGMLGPRLEAGLNTLEGHAYAGMGHMVDIGPTGEQIGDLVSTLEGHRSVGSMVGESLPASTLYKHWLDPSK